MSGLRSLDRSIQGSFILLLGLVLVVGCRGPTGEGEKAVQRAEIHFRNGRYSKALAEYERALADNPENYAARLGAGRCYLAKNELDKAREAFERSSTILPAQADPWLGLARIALATETPDYSAATRYCAEAIRREPKRADIRTFLGTVFRRRGMQAEAVHIFRQAIALDPQNAGLRVLLASSLLELGQTEEAKRVLEQALEQNLAGSGGIRTALSQILQMEGELEEALALVENLKGEEITPTARHQRGRLYLIKARDPQIGLAEAEGLRQKARAEAEAILALDPHSLAGLEIKGIALFDQKEYDEALLVFQDVRLVIEHRFKLPRDFPMPVRKRVAMLLLHLGRCYLETDLPRKANEEFIRAWNWDPAGIDTHFWSAIAQLQTDDRQGAMITLEKMIEGLDSSAFGPGGGQGRELYPPIEDRFVRTFENWAEEDPIVVSPLLALAQLSLRLGKPEQCLEWCAKASERAPRRAEAHYLSGAALFQQGKSAEALEALRTAKEVGPSFIPSYVRLAEIYRHGRRPDLAIREYQSALRVRDDLPALLLGLAQSYATLGDEARAIETLSGLLEEDPDDLGALQVLTSIYVRRGRTADPVAYDKMISLCDQILARAPASEWALLVKAEAMIRKGDLEGAEQILKALYQAIPTSVPRSSAYASVLLLRGELTAAGGVAEAAQKICGGSAELAIVEGLAYLLNGNLDRAIKVFSSPSMTRQAPDISKVLTAYAELARGNREAALNLLESLSEHGQEERQFCEEFFSGQDPPSSEAIVTLARLALLSYRGWWTLAFQEASELARGSEDKAWAIWWQGETARNLYQVEKAEGFLRELVEKAPYSGRGWMALATLTGSEDPVKAIGYYRKALPLFAGRMDWLSRIHFAVGALSEEIGNEEQAVREYRLALEQNPDFGLAANNLAWLLMDENLEEARDLARRAVESEPSVGAVRDTYGWICFQMGDLEEALQELRLASSLDPYHPTIRYHTARAFQEAGDTPRVRAELQMALAIGSEFPEKAEAEKLLSEIGDQ